MSLPALPTTDRPKGSPAGSILLFAIVMAMLASWLPHYLTWPWWPDADAWATIAQGWDSGIRPYRDVTIFNFPGQFEISWILGKLFGWGQTWSFYAFDAALLIGFGPLLISWSKRRLDRALPGLIGWAGAVWLYCGLNITLVAQRDWQGPLLTLSCLAILQLGKGRSTTILSAALMASAFAMRPHVLLFLPAIGLAILLESDGWRSAFRRGLLWGSAFAVFATIWFLPLIIQGSIPDFLKGVRQASYGAGYSSTTPLSVLRGVGKEFGIIAYPGKFDPFVRLSQYARGGKVVLTILVLAFIAIVSQRERRWTILPWLSALVLVLFYRPLAPKQHEYLMLPLSLCEAVTYGIVAGILLETIADRRLGERLAAFVFLIAVAMPGLPAFCLPGEAIDAVQGRNRNRVPESARLLFSPGNPNTPYDWNNYQRALTYLRSHSDETTRVANVLRNVPFPAFNGPLGRISPLPGESGIIWLWSVNPKLEPEYVEAIENVPAGSIVIWSPDEKPFADTLNLDLLCIAIRRSYQPEAQFGPFAIWRKM